MSPSKEGKRLINLLAYYNVFNHPLSLNELTQQLNEPQVSVEDELDHYIENKKCFKYGDYFGIDSQIKSNVTNRIKKEKLAQRYFDELPKYVNLIKSFPFVKAIGISGSLSKGVMHEKGDIDYFIITAENRLWICRTLLVLYKKIVLLNSRKYFCVNYFIDTSNLEIQDKNIFTAVEIATLLPVYNSMLIENFKAKNSWSLAFLKPVLSSKVEVNKGGHSNLKRGVEKLLDGLIGEKLDSFFMKLTIKRWESKFAEFDKQKFEQTMRSKRGISKHHPSDFQKKVLTKYNKTLLELNLTNEGTLLT